MQTEATGVPDELRLRRIAVAIREKTAASKQHLEQARADLLDIGDLFLEARQAFTADQDFGAWCAKHTEDYDTRDISRLMVLALNRGRVTKLSRTLNSAAISPRRWLDAINAVIADADAPPLQTVRDSVGDMSPTEPKERPTPETEENQVETAVSEQSSQSKTVPTVTKTLPPTASIYGRQRAQEVSDLLDAMTVKGAAKKSVAGKTHGKHGWPLLLEAIDLGTFRRDGSFPNSPTAGLLFNAQQPRGGFVNTLLTRYDLSTAKGCKAAAEEIMPFLRRHAEVLRPEPGQFETLWKAEERARQAEAEAVYQAQEAQRRADLQQSRLEQMKARGEREVVIAGIQLWPRADGTYYDYQHLRVAWWLMMTADRYATDLAGNRLRERESRPDRANSFRHMTNVFAHLINVPVDHEDQDAGHTGWPERTLTLINQAAHALSRAIERGTDEKLETKIPPDWNHNVNW